MAVPACKRIWFFVKLTISSDMSVSTICDSDARQVLAAHLEVRDRGLEAVLHRTELATVVRDLGEGAVDQLLGARVVRGVGHVDAGQRGERAVGAVRDPGVADRQRDLVVRRHVGADLEHAATGGDRRRRRRGDHRHAGADGRRGQLGRSCRCCCGRARPTRRHSPRSRTLAVTPPVKPALPVSAVSMSFCSSAWNDAAVV